MRAFDGRMRTSDRAVVVLPQPDSPAIPRASPWSSRNDTPSTARTVPEPTVKWVRRSSTTRSGAAGSASLGSGRSRRLIAVVTAVVAPMSTSGSSSSSGSTSGGVMPSRADGGIGRLIGDAAGVG